MAVNLRDLIKNLKDERYNACIIYGDAGIGKSSYFKTFILKNKDINAVYLSVMNEYPQMRASQSLFGFSPIKFINWALSKLEEVGQTPMDVIIIDNFDFIVNLWSSVEKEEFLKLVEKFLEKSVSTIPSIFVLHTEPFIESQLDKKFLTNYSELEIQNIY